MIADAAAASDAWIHFYRSSNNVILLGGIDGVIPPKFIQSVRLLPSHDLLWANEDRRWKVPDLKTNGNPFKGCDTDDDDAVTTKLMPDSDVERERRSDGPNTGRGSSSQRGHMSEYVVTSVVE